MEGGRRKPWASSPPVQAVPASLCHPQALSGGTGSCPRGNQTIPATLSPAPAASRRPQKHPCSHLASHLATNRGVGHLLGCCFQQVTTPLLPGFILTDLTVPLTHNFKDIPSKSVPRACFPTSMFSREKITSCDTLSHLRLQLPSPFGVCTSSF